MSGMSVLIKGLIMPHCCDVCTFSNWSNLHQTASCKLHDYDPCFSDYSREYTDKRADFCPLIEIPEPHGDLIDRGALNIGDYEREDDDTGTREISLGGLLEVYHRAKDAPAIIAREDGETK